MATTWPDEVPKTISRIPSPFRSAIAGEEITVPCVVKRTPVAPRTGVPLACHA